MRKSYAYAKHIESGAWAYIYFESRTDRDYFVRHNSIDLPCGHAEYQAYAITANDLRKKQRLGPMNNFENPEHVQTLEQLQQHANDWTEMQREHYDEIMDELQGI